MVVVRERLWITVIKYHKKECEVLGVFVSESKPDKEYFDSLKREYDYWEIHLFIYPSEQPAKLLEWDL